MGAAAAVATAVTFVWLGMVLAISFLEAPLKFRAPGLTIPVGLAVGRLVFAALNAVEGVLALTIAVAVAVDFPGGGAATALCVAVVVLVVQLLAIRPRLARRSDAVLSGEDSGEGNRSHAHLAFVAAEVVKVVALVAAGVALLATA